MSLIPKNQKPQTFDEFIPISCCNMIYIIIAKVISLRLKPILSDIIFEEKFGFLNNRQIHNVVSLAQETIHTIKKDKQKSFTLTLDLSKSYDRVSWTFVRLLMIKNG